MVKIDFYLDPKYFEEYYEYYKTIDWKSFQKGKNYQNIL